MGRIWLDVGDSDLFERLDDTSFVETQVLVFKPLPMYARMGTSQITSVVEVRDTAGHALPEVPGAEIGDSPGRFSYGADGRIRIAYPRSTFTDPTMAKASVSNYQVIFQIDETARYAPDRFDVKVYDMGAPGITNKTFDTIIVGGEQLLSFLRQQHALADLQKMNPFRVEIFGCLQVGQDAVTRSSTKRNCVVC